MNEQDLKEQIEWYKELLDEADIALCEHQIKFMRLRDRLAKLENHLLELVPDSKN
jgi:hypothetical protein